MPSNNVDIVFIETPISLKQRYGEMASAAHLVPPLGLMSLAAVVRQAGYATTIIDAAALGWSFDQVAEEIAQRQPDYIGLTAATVGFMNTIAMARAIKQKRPEVCIILGGVHATARPLQSLAEHPEIDYIVYGEGEDTLIELLEVLENQGCCADVRGIAYRDSGGVVVTPPRPLIKELDRLPFPAWDLVPDLRTNYHPAPHLFRRLPSTTISTSRGCFGKCTFCDRSVFGNKCRAFSAEYLIRMLKHLIEHYGLKDVWIGDDLFVMFRSRLRKFCELVISEKLDLTWACCARIGMLKPDLLALMKQAGCHEIVFGIESGNQHILENLQKDITLEEVEHDLALTKRAGIRTNGTFMIGLPNETKTTMQNSINFAKKIDLDMIQLSFFTPFPGCEIADHVEQYGTFKADYTKMNVFGNIVFVPHSLTREDLIRYYKKFYREFYLRPKTVFSFLRKLDSFRELLAYTGGALAVMKLAFQRNKDNY
ncbi:cobalamin-dependent protein [bacterium]|nr:cobalamin-dependent protein [bacterium]